MKTAERVTATQMFEVALDVVRNALGITDAQIRYALLERHPGLSDTQLADLTAKVGQGVSIIAGGYMQMLESTRKRMEPVTAAFKDAGF